MATILAPPPPVEHGPTAHVPAASAARPAAVSARLVSLDVFRGITIAAMILVNNPGSWSAIYWPLQHAEWHGWTPTDLIFPFFLFIAGVSMVYSFSRREVPRSSLILHTLRRSVVIFAVGFFLTGFPFFHLSTIRVPGVLQRIAVCYLFAAIVVICTRWRAQAVVAAALLLTYWALMTLVPVPGYGAGRLDPEGNLAAYVDRALMLGHLWKPRWDPEGLLSTLPAVATVLLGALTGHWLRSNRTMPHKTAGLVAAGACGLALGSLWNLWFPINKNLWTSSYVIFTGGFAALCLAVCYWVVDVRGWRRWFAPFLWHGMNSIFIFTLSGIIAKLSFILKTTMPDGSAITYKGFVYQSLFTPFLSPINASLAFALANVLLFTLVVGLLFRAKLFIKI